MDYFNLDARIKILRQQTKDRCVFFPISDVFFENDKINIL